MSQLTPSQSGGSVSAADTSDATGKSTARVTDDRPNLLADPSFWGLTVTQFLGAFNDNLYKQLMLLLAIPVGAAVTGDVQGYATLVFSLPFVLFSGYAGFLSDRNRKTPIIVWCKVGEIGVMALGLLAFYFFGVLGTAGTWTVLFLMGMQSSFFGPSKYGVLPELFRPSDLPRANGLILMTTFLAIIFGTVMAGSLKKWLVGIENDPAALWPALIVCVTIAILGTLSSLMIRKTPAAQPGIRLTPDSLAVSGDIFALLKRDRTLLAAVMVSSVFWLISGIAVPTVNRLGLGLLNLGDDLTSVLTATIGLGIMVGALGASWLCRKGWGDRCVTWGLWGIFGCLVGLGMWSGNQHVLGFGGSIVALTTMGIFAAIFAIPIQVFLQDRPPAELKGRMIATMNQANFIGILISGPLYQLFEFIAGRAGIPISSVFWMMAALLLPVAAFYRLDSRKLTQSAA